MKKKKLFITATLLTLFSTTQAQLQNPSFEEWNGLIPLHWNDVQNFNQFGGIVKTDDAVDGDSAIIIHNWYYYVPSQIGTKQSVSAAPEKLTGFYKLMTENTSDLKRRAKCEISVLDADNNYIGGGDYLLDSTSTYTPFEFQINYLTQANSNAEKIEIKFTSSNGYFCATSDCNFLYLDNLDLTYHPNSTSDVSKSDVRLFNNVVSNELQILGLNKASTAIIYDLNGRLLGQYSTEKSINVSALTAGTYIVSIQTENQTIQNFKFQKN